MGNYPFICETPPVNHLHRAAPVRALASPSPSPSPIRLAIRPVLEHLERRRLLAATATLSNGIVTITGTTADDRLLVTEDPSANVVRVSLNGATQQFAAASVTEFHIRGDLGDDELGAAAAATVARNFKIYGGGGNDTIRGSARSDSLYGEAGRDSIVAGSYNDHLDGGDDNDTLDGGGSTDALYGGDGDDTLIDTSDSGILDGGAGVDTINGVREEPTTAPAPSNSDSRPDLWIRNRRDSAYLGDGVYSADGSNQVRSQSSSFEPPIYELRIQNDGTVADSFTITGDLTDNNGWRVAYYDSYQTGFYGATNITSKLAAGWKTYTLQPGEAISFRVDVTPTYWARGGSVKDLAIRAVSTKDSKQVDVVRAKTTATVVRTPEIRRRNFDDSGVYLVDIYNEGNVDDHFRIKGSSGGTGYSVRYFDAYFGGNDVTSQVTNDGWVTSVVRKQAQEMRVEIIATTAAKPGITLTATSTASSAATDFARITKEEPIDGPDFFLVGVWSQPAYSFDKWVDRGINTVVRHESLSGTVSANAWSAEARKDGLYYIRQPQDDPTRDIGDSRLLAWMHEDEPDSRGDTPEELQANHDRLKAIDPSRPLTVNLTGSRVLPWQNVKIPRSTYEDYLDTVDWVSNAQYPVTGWNRPEDLNAPGLTLDRLEKWSEGKPQFAILESSDQELRWGPTDQRGPTVKEFRAQIWDSIVRGAQGVIYFPQSLEPDFKFDNTPTEIADEMVRQHAYIEGISGALVSPVDPADIGASVSGPLEVTWRKHDGKYYYVVFNMSDRNVGGQKITLHNAGGATSARVYDEARSETIAGGVITDDFGAYGVHVYVVDAPATTPVRLERNLAPPFRPQMRGEAGVEPPQPSSSSPTAAVYAEAERVVPRRSAFSARPVRLTEVRDILA
jgi:hypothetical protein